MNSGITQKLSGIADGLITFFQQLHLFEKIVVVLGVINLPGYIVGGKLVKLFVLINAIGNQQSIPTLQIVTILIQTAVIIYSIVLFILQYPTKNNAPLKFEGYHPALTFTTVPEYLLAPPIQNPNENLNMVDIPNLNDILSNDVTKDNEIPSIEDLFKYYDNLKNDQPKETPIANNASESQIKNMLNVLMDQKIPIDKILDEI